MSTTLFTVQPTHTQRLSSGIGEEWAVYYRVPNGNLEALTNGYRFAVVRSPSLYRHGSHWSLTQFEIHDVYQPDKKKTDRSYIQRATRPLTAEEITHMETLIQQAREDMYATPELSQEATPGAAQQTGAEGSEAGDYIGLAPTDRTSVAHLMAEEPQRTSDLQEQTMEGT